MNTKRNKNYKDSKGKKSKFSSKSQGRRYSKRDDDTHSEGIVKRDRTQGAEERYYSETGPSMKSPNVKDAKNDASWYMYSPEMTNVAGSINYNDAIGIPYTNEWPTTIGDDGTTHTATAPSLMAIKWCPTPGMIGSPSRRNASNAPVNLQLRSLYSLMQATVTQNLPFAAADLGIHLFYMDNVFMFFGHLQRLYYLIRLYRVLNTTMPKCFFKAYGLDPDTIWVNDYSLNDFQADLLMIEQDIRRIAVPSGFDILNRHYWMSKHVFKDDNIGKAQMYMFIPDYIWQFDPEGNTGGELVLYRLPSFTTNGIKGMVDYFRGFLSAFYNDKDVWTMNGYILRAFNNFFTPDSLDINGILEPVYEPEVLVQIHNATPVGRLIYYHGPGAVTGEGVEGRIMQTAADNIVWDGAAEYRTNSVCGAIRDPRVMVDVPIDNPDPATNLVATRLITRTTEQATDLAAGGSKLPFESYGTEIPTYISIYDGYNDAENESFSHAQWGLNIWDAGASGVVIDPLLVVKVAQVSKFTYAPMMPLTIDHGEQETLGVDVGWFDYIGEMRNYTVVDKSVLSKLHDAAAMGEWLIK